MNTAIDYLITEDGQVVKGQYLGRHARDFRKDTTLRRENLKVIKECPSIQKEIYELFQEEIKKLEKQIEIERQEVIDWYDKNWKSANEFKKEKEMQRAMCIKPGFKQWQVEQLKVTCRPLTPRPSGRNKGNGWVEPELIERANDVPIDSIMEFDRGNKALCLWHSEDTPSLSYHKEKNFVKCFGQCGSVHSAIDVYQKINNCDFVTAVRELTQTHE